MLKNTVMVLFSFLPMLAYSLSLKDHYPQNYVVQNGDTIFEIAEKYLNKPWEWKKIWRSNPHIKNPKRLYPGMVLKLEYLEGRPVLKMVRGGTYKLSPHQRARPAKKEVPPIHLSDIQPFLNGSRVFDYNELAFAPYVVDYVGEHLIGGQNVELYVQNLTKHAGKNPKLSYTLYRPEGVYRSPNDKNNILGYIGTYIADAQLLKAGQPATVILTTINQGVKIKDKLFPNTQQEFPPYFEPQAPNVRVEGTVIDLFGGLTQVAKNQVIVIDKGKKQGMKAGDVLAIYEPPRPITDPEHPEKTITLPKERVGLTMVFRTFTQTSYALIVKSIRAINKFDLVENP